MREKRYTAGPWVAHPNDEGGYGRGAYVTITNESASKIIATARCHDDWLNEQPYEANAHLIAASPDLLEALEGLLEVTDVDGPETASDPDEDSVGWYGDGKPLPMTFGHVRRARAAISKAYGESE